MTSDITQRLEYRLGEGGLLRRLEGAVRLTHVRAQIAAAVLLTWLPIVSFSLLVEARGGAREPLFYQPAMHVRLLVAMPILLILDHVFPKVCRQVLELLTGQDFVPPQTLTRLEKALRKAGRATDSPVPEALLALLSVGVGVATYLGYLPLIGFTHQKPLSPAQVWYALVDMPLFQFLLWRSLWRWLIWIRVLYHLSRLDLRLVPTHPDRCGGIAFLRLPSIDYCALLLFAAASVLCAEWSVYLQVGDSLSSFKPLILAFGTLATLVAFGPLLSFSPLLYRTRRAGLLEASNMATAASRRFQQRWIHGEDHGGRSFGFDVQSLAATVQAYRETVEQMRVVMFDKKDLLKLLTATLLPSVPILVRRVPTENWLQLLSLFTGGFVG
jgi:hypothetical protein